MNFGQYMCSLALCLATIETLLVLLALHSIPSIHSSLGEGGMIGGTEDDCIHVKEERGEGMPKQEEPRTLRQRGQNCRDR